MKRRILSIWNFMVKSIGYLILTLILIALFIYFIWMPYKVSTYEPSDPAHLPQKTAYLESIEPLESKVNQESPNVVIILFDDLGYGDLSCYGNRLIKTPTMDSLAANGVRLNHFYSSSPVCTPSRAGLLTGRLPIRARAGDHVYFPEDHFVAKFRKIRGSVNELPKDEILLPEVMKAAGYRTGMIGKWHLGDIDGHQPNDFGFDEYYGVRYSNDMLPLHIYGNREIEEEDQTTMANGSKSHLDPHDELSVEGIDQTLLTEKYTAEAKKFITQHIEEPFLLFFSHSFPHVPHYASKDHAGNSDGGLYGDVVEDLDRSVKAIYDALVANGLLENTLLIITSDNGGDYNGSAGNLRGRKQETYEGGQRVPMIVSYPNGLTGELETNEIAMNTDIFPTILSLLNIPLPQDRKIDGKNIMSLLSGGPSPHDVIYYTSAGTGKIKGVRNGQYKYHTGGYQAMPLIFGLGAIINRKPQLNDMLRDNESHNLIKKYPEIAAGLENKMNTKIEELEKNERGWIEL